MASHQQAVEEANGAKSASDSAFRNTTIGGFGNAADGIGSTDCEVSGLGNRKFEGPCKIGCGASAATGMA